MYKDKPNRFKDGDRLFYTPDDYSSLIRPASLQDDDINWSLPVGSNIMGSARGSLSRNALCYHQAPAQSTSKDACLAPSNKNGPEFQVL